MRRGSLPFLFRFVLEKREPATAAMRETNVVVGINNGVAADCVTNHR